jgi:hypothetical protein
MGGGGMGGGMGGGAARHHPPEAFWRLVLSALSCVAALQQLSQLPTASCLAHSEG